MHSIIKKLVPRYGWYESYAKNRENISRYSLGGFTYSHPYQHRLGYMSALEQYHPLVRLLIKHAKEI